MNDAVIHSLEEEIRYLRSLLDENGISYDFEAFRRRVEDVVEVPIDITPETAKFFFSMFHGRVDVYAARSNSGYYTVCNNRWNNGLCPKQNGKKDVIIFDYIDQYVPMLERMYHKRLRTYKRIGFEICSQVADRQVVNNSIFDCQNYSDAFGNDIASAMSEVVISSPGLGSRKVWKFIKEVAPLQERGVHIAIMTLSPSAYPDDAAEHQKEPIEVLASAGIAVRCAERCGEHFAVIDNSIVWYGSMNLLSREKEEDSMMRIENASIAQELLLKWAGMPVNTN